MTFSTHPSVSENSVLCTVINHSA